MKPKQKLQEKIKAKELFLKFRTKNYSNWINDEDAKKMALIAVDEILSAKLIWYQNNFWKDVKLEIEKL